MWEDRAWKWEGGHDSIVWGPELYVQKKGAEGACLHFFLLWTVDVMGLAGSPFLMSLEHWAASWNCQLRLALSPPTWFLSKYLFTVTEVKLGHRLPTCWLNSLPTEIYPQPLIFCIIKKSTDVDDCGPWLPWSPVDLAQYIYWHI